MLWLKNQYPDTMILLRLGDFYETFGEDARVVAEVCGLTLNEHNKLGVPCAGVPFHSINVYTDRLTAAGYKVARCEAGKCL